MLTDFNNSFTVAFSDQLQKNSGGASSENSPGPGKVLKIFGRSFYRGVFEGGGLRLHPREVRRYSHLAVL